VHFHVCAVDGVFEEVAGEGGADAQAQARAQACAPGVIFHPATGIDTEAVAKAQASLRRRILRAFVGRGLLEGFEAQEMQWYNRRRCKLSQPAQGRSRAQRHLRQATHS
jgi:hypothetical protein